MIIDKEEHRVALLQLIEQSSIAGSALDIVWELKQAIKRATIAPDVRDSGRLLGERHDAQGAVTAA